MQWEMRPLTPDTCISFSSDICCGNSDLVVHLYKSLPYLEFDTFFGVVPLLIGRAGGLFYVDKIL
jgi:hypothetical protein